MSDTRYRLEEAKKWRDMLAEDNYRSAWGDERIKELEQAIAAAQPPADAPADTLGPPNWPERAPEPRYQGLVEKADGRCNEEMEGRCSCPVHSLYTQSLKREVGGTAYWATLPMKEDKANE